MVCLMKFYDYYYQVCMVCIIVFNKILEEICNNEFEINDKVVELDQFKCSLDEEQ